MSRTQNRIPRRELTLVPVHRLCTACGQDMRIRYENQRTLVTLNETVRLRLKICRCEAQDCARFHKPYRPEVEGILALPQHEFGLDVVVLAGALHHLSHHSALEIHRRLRWSRVPISERSVTNLLDRYEKMLAVNHLGQKLTGQDRIILAVDNLKLDYDKVLLILRDCLSGTMFLARGTLVSTVEQELAILISRVINAVDLPVAGVITYTCGYWIYQVVRSVLPDVPCQSLAQPYRLHGWRDGWHNL